MDTRLESKIDNLDNTIKILKQEKEAHRRCAVDLRLTGEKYRCLMDSFGEGVLLLDAEEKFIEANKKMQELLGFSEVELLTMNLGQIFPQKELERARAALGETVQSGLSNLTNAWIIRKDDQVIPVNFAGVRVENGGKPIIQGIFRARTEPPQGGQ